MRKHADEASSTKQDRHTELVKIAYHEIVEKGFEGLRIRDVAAKAGVNNATLHYYFRTKETLIHGVVQYLMQEFTTQRIPRENNEESNALNAIRYEFEDMRFRLKSMPEMFTVLAELSLRSRRDAGIAEMMKQTKLGWSHYLRGLLMDGIEQGVIRKSIDVEATIDLIMLQMSAIGYQSVELGYSDGLDRIISLLIVQTERFLTVED